MDEKLEFSSIQSAAGVQSAGNSEAPGEPDPTYEQLRDIMLYMGGPVNYDRYVDPAIYRRLAELGLVAERANGAIEFTTVGADVFSSLTAGNEAPELLGRQNRGLT